jgi:hypothetical protein
MESDNVNGGCCLVAWEKCWIDLRLGQKCNTPCYGLLNHFIRTLIKNQIKWIINF